MATQVSPLKTAQTKIMHTPAKTSSSSHPSSITKVRVIIRVRPFLAQEIWSKNGNPICCVSVLGSEFDCSEEVTVHLKDPDTSRNECYKLDAFFGQEDNNVGQIFQTEVSPLIPGIFHGSNATVFAYGATGSGKTYTMQGTDELPGLMPLAMSTILSTCQNTGSSAEISYYEVYMDRCYDLLELKAKEIAVWDDRDGQIHLKGLARVPVNSMCEFQETFSLAIQRRKVAHTGLNNVSSRSHGVLVIAVSTPCADGSGNHITGKLNLIDLAGNEDNRRTCNEGVRLLESAKINQSLFALSNVIYALNNNKSRVPYRESKLTRILQDSLGGTSRALMVACLNPGEFQESVHTVSLAARSRHISNFVYSTQKQETPKVKVDMETKLRAWLESKGKTKSAQRMAFGSPFLQGTPGSVSSVKNSSTCPRSAKREALTSQGVFEERALHTPRRNLFNHGGRVHTTIDTKDIAAARTTNEEFGASDDRIMLQSKTCLPDQALDEEGNRTTIKFMDSLALSPACEKIKSLQSSRRKVLSPINSNRSGQNSSFRDQVHQVLFDPMTPTPHSILTAENNYQMNGSPIDKYSAWSSKLKSSLVQEYVDFLNQASRDELLELKGIGQKIAEYILELRESSPLKSLSDLEKIGLSSKQVYNMFGRAARGIFD